MFIHIDLLTSFKFSSSLVFFCLPKWLNMIMNDQNMIILL